MLLWVSLLVLAPVIGELAAAKPVISLHPPWTTVFRGETVTLTCNASRVHTAENRKWYRWFLGATVLRDTPGNTLKARNSGMYRCQTRGSLLSDGVSLIFSSGRLVLQAPASVFEGDTLVLRCGVRAGEKLGPVTYSWKGKVVFSSPEARDLAIPQASLNNSGFYGCTGFLQGNRYSYRSSARHVHIQELFPQPKLEVIPPQPMEGGSVNLSCRTQLPLERSDAVLSFSFFRDRGVVLSNWSSSPELQITAVWREDSGSYWCEASAAVSGIHKRSLPLQVRVHGVPVSAVLLETLPQGGHVLAGERLVLVCSVAEGTGDTTFSWHREDTGERLGSTRQRSQRAELEIPAAWGSHTGWYYCTADNGLGLARSGALNVTVTGTPGNRSGLIAAKAAGVLLSILLLAVVLWIYPRRRRNSGRGFPGNTARSPPATGPEEAPQAGCPAPGELLWSYDKAHAGEGDLVYSEIQCMQLGQEGAARTSRTSLEDKHDLVVYSAVKTRLPEDSAGELRSQDEDAVKSYENVQFA
ncbi:LOW QUALITY PROTEIN: Fc receptor-like protein 4 [Mustela putorius furo]|uniref:LOW QUALITY PROTEIN: Fc receptor-like protein 4 n=1 Tax=Mustela putorius furo TaxID=9669 RepID=A0A8U0SJP4_MUSPF|nr:LOW QUALITY PROTEIN: Fc receptor-like protein 4 [Mustela putorius furo]